MADTPQKIGEVTHYYTNLQVGTVMLKHKLAVGDKIRFQGHTTDFEQVVSDMQFEHQAVEKAKAGQEVGLRVDQKVRDGDEVFVA